MISILIDTYNHERFIRDAIASVFAQTWLQGRSDYEIVVVDDGSTDTTPEILASYGDAIRVVRKINGGQASAFAAGLAHCTGEIVLFLDGDDWWHPEKVAAVMAEFNAHPDCLAVGHGIIIADDLSGSRDPLAPPARMVLSLAREDDVQPFLRNLALLGTSRFAARRDALDRVGSPPDALTYEADEYFFTLVPAIGDVHILPECLTYYRLHGTNLYQASKSLTGVDLGRQKLAERAGIFRCLADVLPQRLRELGLPEVRVAAIHEPLDIAATRLELEVFGGRRTATLDIERRSQALLAARGQRTRLLVRAGVFVASLLLPPSSFYSLRTRYAGSKLRRLIHGLPVTAAAGTGQSEADKKGNS